MARCVACRNNRIRGAYTLCGSFVRFYLDEGEEPEGRREALAALYRSGGMSEPALGEWIERWGRSLSADELSPQALNWAKGRYRRPSVFYKVCAHEIAERRARASRAESAQDWPQGLAGALVSRAKRCVFAC